MGDALCRLLPSSALRRNVPRVPVKLLTSLRRPPCGSRAAGSSTVSVSDPAVQASGGFHYNATEGQALTNLQLLTFTDPAGAEATSAYSGTIQWGDGQSSSGTIGTTSPTGTFTVSGSHT